MRDNFGKLVDVATPSMPVEIAGWKDMPEIGELVEYYANEVGRFV